MGSEMRGTVYVIALCHCLKDPLVLGQYSSVGVKQAEQILGETWLLLLSSERYPVE